MAISAQAQAALNLANEVRVKRAEARKRIYAMSHLEGREAVAELLIDPPDWLHGEVIGRLLSWPRRSGGHAVRRILSSGLGGWSVGERVRVGALTERQRNVIAAYLTGREVSVVISKRRCPGCQRELPLNDYFYEYRETEGEKRFRQHCHDCRRKVQRLQRRQIRERKDMPGDMLGNLPAEPFRRWLNARRSEFPDLKRMAQTLGMPEKTLRDCMNGARPHVRYTTVDTAATNYGALIWDIYPDEVIADVSQGRKDCDPADPVGTI